MALIVLKFEWWNIFFVFFCLLSFKLSTILHETADTVKLIA